MSDTTKTNEGPRKSQDTVARFANAPSEAASKTVKEAATSADVMTNAATEAAKSAERTRETATEAGAKIASAGTQVGNAGFSATAEAGGRMADIGYDRGRRLLDSTTQAMNVYTDARQRSAEHVQALMTSAVTFSQGLQKMQHAWLENLNGSMERATRRSQDLLRCKTLAELAEVQCDLYTDAINRTFESSSRLLELASHTAQEAARPLQARMH
jgi:phasin family protein